VINVYRNAATEPMVTSSTMEDAIGFAEREINASDDKPVFWLRDTDEGVMVAVLPRTVETFLRTTTRHPGYLP
jgi:hypothetical protein